MYVLGNTISEVFILVLVEAYTNSPALFRIWLTLSNPVANNVWGLLIANAVITLNGYWLLALQAASIGAPSPNTKLLSKSWLSKLLIYPASNGDSNNPSLSAGMWRNSPGRL